MCRCNKKQQEEKGKTMAKKITVRVDDRLIHGQVVTQWVRVAAAEKIVVIDDKVAANKMQQSVLKMAAPVGIKVCMYSVEKAAAQWAKNEFGTKNVLVLFRDVEQIEALEELGVKFDKITLGQMAISNGRKQVYKQVGFTAEEAATLFKLRESGTDIVFQMQPTDKEEPLDILKKVFPDVA